MPSFCTVLNCSSNIDRDKDKSYSCFPSVVKNNSEGGLKLSKVRREKCKWLAQIFRKYLTERKVERKRARIKIMLSVSSLSVFSRKFHSIIFEKQIHICMVIELGLPVSESSIRILKFYDPLIQNTNLIKRESKLTIYRFRTGVPLILNLQSWPLHLVQLTVWDVLNFHIPIYKVLEQS